jgi:tetratricopeptide (TPR) repeat protein
MHKFGLLSWVIVVFGCTTHGDPQPEPSAEEPRLLVAELQPPVLDPPVSGPVLGQRPAPELRWTEARCDVPPVSLTASDGSGLQLTRFAAEAVVHGPLAFTELRLVFHNPEDRQIEGRFSVTLPEDAAISRLAMNIDGRWQEGEVVEKQAARIAYEDFLHRRQDPALMEREAGNIYSARVFPIPANGEKQLIVSYSQELTGTEPYRLPLCGLPSVGALDVEVHVEQAIVDGTAPSRWSEASFEVHERQHAPRGDVEVHNLGASAAYGVGSGELMIASISPRIDVDAQAIARAVILFDTSASRANDFSGQVARLGELVRALGASQPGLLIEVLAFDQDVEQVYAGLAVEFGEAAAAKLIARGPLGASAFDLALDAVASASQRGVVPDRLILVSDGMLTAGAELDALAARLQQLEADGLRRLDVIVDGNSADQAALTALARGELPEHGVVLRGSTPLREIVERLGASTRSGIKVEVEGATWVWPKQLDGMQPGDATLIYAQLSSAKLGAHDGERVNVKVTLDGETTEVPMLSAPVPLLERAQSRAIIAAHEAALLGELTPEAAASIRADIIEESVRSRVLSDLTALLVLETEADYRRFGIERNALADILVVGEQGVELLRRGDDALVVARRDPRTWQADDHDKKNKITSASRGSDDGGSDDGGSEDAFASDARKADDGSSDMLAGVSSHTGQGYGVGHGRAAIAARSESRAAPEDVMRDPMPEPSRDEPSERGEQPLAPEPIHEAPSSESEPSNGDDEPADTNGGSEPPPDSERPGSESEPPPRANAHVGRYATIMRWVSRGEIEQARADARAWVAEAPGDVLAMVALGDVLAATDERAAAARAYGSLIDLYPARTDIRRMAGARLEALDEAGLALAEDSYRRALEQRPDHPSGYRLLAWVLVKRGALAEAFDVLERSVAREYPDDRYAGVKSVLRQDLGIVAAIWIAREPAREVEIRERVLAQHTRVDNRYSMRFVLNWETDANDVDLHVWDDEGGHAFYGATTLASGGELTADVTTGYGPEAFVINGRKSGFPYRLMAHYYARGAMGYGMGKLEVLEHDGQGNIAFSEHPFVVMKDDAWVDLTLLRHRLLR